MAYQSPRSIAAMQARTTNGDSGALTAPLGRNLNILCNVQAASGTTPSMTLEVQWWDEAGGAWASASPADNFTAITAAGGVVKQFSCKAVTYRVTWTITGTTPSFTFGLQEYVT